MTLIHSAKQVVNRFCLNFVQFSYAVQCIAHHQTGITFEAVDVRPTTQTKHRRPAPGTVIPCPRGMFTRSKRGGAWFIPCMVQKPCTPIRSAKGNPARPLIGGPPRRAHRTQWHGFTGKGWTCSIRRAQGRTGGINQGQGQHPANTGTSASTGHRTRARAGRPHGWHR